MIVISGALVLVALALLIAGLVTAGGLTLVYISIGVSIVSGLFLVAGVFQRRGEPLSRAPAAEPVGEPRPAAALRGEQETIESVTPIHPAPRGGAAAAPLAVEPVTAEFDEYAPAEEDLEQPAAGLVYVVEGRPRYHAEGCRYLADKDVDALDVDTARDEGFTPCGVCRPDEALGAPAAAEPEAEPALEPEPVPRPRRTAAATRAPAAVSAPPARGASAGRGGVVVIPDRGKYHQADCRYVRGNADAVELTKATARRQGYEPCGVCKP